MNEEINKNLDLKKKGKSWLGLCPFHKEKTPSFTVNYDEDMYYCFGCHRGGDIDNLLDHVADRALFKCIESGENGLDYPEEFNLIFKMGGGIYEDVYVLHKTFDSEPSNSWRDLFYLTNPLYYPYFLKKYFNTRDRFSEQAKDKIERMILYAYTMIARKPGKAEKQLAKMVTATVESLSDFEDDGREFK